MKKHFDNKIVQGGVVLFLVVAASILLNFLLVSLPLIWRFIVKIVNIMMPLIYGLVLAYIMNPMVQFFERKFFGNVKSKTVKRNLSIFVTFVVIIGILATLFSIIIPQLLLSIKSLVVNVPGYLKDLEHAITGWLNSSELEKAFLENFGSISSSLTGMLNNVVLPMSQNTMTTLSMGIFGIFSFVFNFVIGMVFAVYILANTSNFSSGITKSLNALFPEKKVDGFIKEVKHINKVFMNFLIGKVCDSFGFVFTMTLLFLLIFGFPYPLLIAVIIALTDLIPYFGPYIGTIPSALLLCMVSPIKAITFIIFIIVLQQIDGNLVTPKIQRKSTGLPSFWVLFAITLFGGLFGLVGLLIAVPCFTIIYELYNDFINSRIAKNDLKKIKE